MEIEEQQSNMWISAKLLHAFLPASEFKKLGKQVFDGGKDGKWGTIDLKFSSLVDRMHQTLPKDLWAIIYDLCQVHNNKDKQQQEEEDKNLINQAYVNSYAVHEAFPKNTWEKSDYQYSFKRDIYTIPYDNEQEKILEIKYKEGLQSKVQIITVEYPGRQRPDCIKNEDPLWGALCWAQEGDICFAVYTDRSGDGKSKLIQCTDLSTNRTCTVPLNIDEISEIASIHDLKLDYKRNILFCSIVQRRFTWPLFDECQVCNCYFMNACSYKKENQTLSFDTYRLNNAYKSKLNSFGAVNTYITQYDNNSGLCYDDSEKNIISFMDIFTEKKYFKKEMGKNLQSFHTSCFDSDIGIFTIDDNERTAYIFKPQLNHERMFTFIKTMKPYDRMLMHNVLKASIATFVQSD